MACSRQKIKYGLQLYGNVRTKESDEKCADFKAIQVLQNNLLRFLNGSKIKDKISVRNLLTKFELLSVNQLAAQIKLGEMWKAMIIEDYPLKVEQRRIMEEGAATRAATSSKPCEIGKSLLANAFEEKSN